jgi:OHCU decarboxylase
MQRMLVVSVAVALALGLSPTALADHNATYEQRFGHVFLICATGLTADQMLAALTERLDNDADTEHANAAEEQRKITRLRLEKLLCPPP